MAEDSIYVHGPDTLRKSGLPAVKRPKQGGNEMRRKTMCVIPVMIVIALSLFAAGRGEKGRDFAGDYAFGGSTTVEPVVLAAIEEFREIYPGARISYDSQGSSVGIKGVLAGTYSLGGSSRDLKDSEKAEGALATTIALDGVAVIVNKATVPVDNLTLEQIAGIFSGEIVNWNQLGGPSAAIVVFNRDEASGTRDCFNEIVIKPSGKKFTASAAIVTSNGDMVAKVGSVPYSIGYCGFGYIGKDQGTKAVNVGSVAPVVTNVLNKTYAIMRTLNIVHKGPVAEGSLERAFIDFLLSANGQAIVKEEGFIPLK
jgi:phosphate transport system substrate-binding protein